MFSSKYKHISLNSTLMMFTLFVLKAIKGNVKKKNLECPIWLPLLSLFFLYVIASIAYIHPVFGAGV